MNYKDYDAVDGDGECEGSFFIEDIEQHVTYHFTFDTDFEHDGYAKPRNVRVTASIKGGVDLVPVFNDPDIWAAVEDAIESDLETHLNDEFMENLRAQDYAYEQHKEARLAA